MLKLNIREAMQAQSYAAYMVAVSCFSSSVCTTPQMKERSYLLYRMAGDKKQKEMKKRIESLWNKSILCHMDVEFLSSKVEIRFLPQGSGIRISDGFKVLEISQKAYLIKDRKRKKRKPQNKGLPNNSLQNEEPEIKKYRICISAFLCPEEMR